MNAASGTKSQTFSKALNLSAVLVRRWSGTIEHWTTGCERLYGYPAEFAVGRDCAGLLKTRFFVPYEEIETDLLQLGAWNGEIEHERSDGTRIVLSAQWVWMEMPQLDSSYVVETHIDVTPQTRMREQIKSAHAELQRLSQELIRSNEDLEQFARIASHDLSAPINSTRWLVEVFIKRHSDRLNEDGLKCIDQISRSLARMSDLVDGVLSHARAGRQPISSGLLIDAGESLSVAVESLESDIQTSGATITYDHLPEVAIAPQALTQLFQNLLSNALKYAKPGIAPRIHVAAVQIDGFWQFAVQDNGIGIEPRWFDRIFEPMQRLAQTDVAGSGIGLATCRRIVSRAGGTIWVESEPGMGSSFYFTLPGAHSVQAAESAPTPD